MMAEKRIDKMNEFLRNELSAVETYEMALKTTKHADFASALQQLRNDHAQRVGMIRDKIREWGGEPSETSGVWGAFAKVVQAGADILGNTVAISALEEGEDHGLKLYRDILNDTDVDVIAVRNYVSAVLLPAQQKSHDACRSLKRFAKNVAA
jgi:uncharacterized protein (TIGR02284 family)